MFEKSTWIRLPRNVVIGHGVIEQTADAVADLHISGRPLVVTSPTAGDVAGDAAPAAAVRADGLAPSQQEHLGVVADEDRDDRRRVGRVCHRRVIRRQSPSVSGWYDRSGGPTASARPADRSDVQPSVNN